MTTIPRVPSTPFLDRPSWGESRALALALAVSVAAAALTRGTWPLLSRTPFVLFFAAVFVGTHWGSRRAGLVSVVVNSALALWVIPQGAFEAPPYIIFVAVGLIGTYLIGDRDAAHAALQKSEAQFRATWEHGALGTALLNRDGRVLGVNPSLERILGYAGGAWVGAPFDTFSDPSDTGGNPERFAALMSGREPYYQREQRYRRADGAIVWGRVTVSAIFGPTGAATGALMVIEDVTARRQAETDLRASEAKLRRSQKMEAVGQLVAGVAHNFNNLLTIATGYTDLLQERHAADEDDRADLEEIRTALERGADLTRQLMAFSRKQDTVATQVDLNRMVSRLRDILTRVIREDVHLTIDVSDAPETVRMDPHDLEQIILNLVVNARDAMPEGGALHLGVSRQHVDASNSPLDTPVAPGEYVRLCVRDTGSGMTPDVQAHLFEPFFTTKEVGKGTGLGLAFVYGIVRNHRGFITVETSLGRGTTFNVYLPWEPADAKEEAGARRAVSASSERADATILLVEDEDGVRAVASRTLARAGYRVLEAAKPSEARAIFDLHGHEIDLLLTDVIMPEMHGPALASELVDARPDLRVLFVSGYSDTSPMARGARSDQNFLAKPFTPASLLSAVSDALGDDAAVPRQ